MNQRNIYADKIFIYIMRIHTKLSRSPRGLIPDG